MLFWPRATVPADHYQSRSHGRKALHIRGMRVTVGMIVEALAAGRSVENLLSDFPYLEEPDIREALAYAANLAQGREFPLAS
jgi:uncharacterized protein (DUF433 family)